MAALSISSITRLDFSSATLVATHIPYVTEVMKTSITRIVARIWRLAASSSEPPGASPGMASVTTKSPIRPRASSARMLAATAIATSRKRTAWRPAGFAVTYSKSRRSSGPKVSTSRPSRVPAATSPRAAVTPAGSTRLNR